ncbi:MAG: hypothetical protein JWM27_1767 [Gemmatimonadetes bacterium]|nr:hypothetical protein [Gemmatimonadota bacterium]
MDVRILAVPYDAGHRDRRMGRGPHALLAAGLADGLRALGHEVRVETVGEHPDFLASRGFPTEVATSFSVWYHVRERVRDARLHGDLPVILTGNCGAALGIVGGLQAAAGTGDSTVSVDSVDSVDLVDSVDSSHPAASLGSIDNVDPVDREGSVAASAMIDFRSVDAVGSSEVSADARPSADALGVVWMDAHGDFNTPDTSASGFLDGMSLATLVGRCWRALAGRVVGAPVPERNVLLIASRDVDAEEDALLRASRITRLSAAEVRGGGAFDAALAELRGRAARVYLHVDLDTLDPRDANANAFAAPDGLRAAELVDAVRRVGRALRLEAICLSAYDPDADADGRVPPIALRVLAAALATLIDD